MSVPFPLVGRFSADASLEQRLLEFQRNVENALHYLDRRKDERYTPRQTGRNKAEAEFWDLWVLDTAGQAIDLILPRVRARDAGARVAVLRTSASNAATVHATGTTVNSAATDAPATGSLVVYTTDGVEWWSP